MVDLGDPASLAGLRAGRRRGADARPRRPTSPTISDDGKTITYHDQATTSSTRRRSTARSTAADVKYAIERSLLPRRRQRLRPDATSPASRASTRRSSRPRTTRPAAPRHHRHHRARRHDARHQAHRARRRVGVLGALTLPVTAPVPEEYAKQYDAENPSTYGEHQVGDRPVHDRERRRGELTGYTPSKEINLVRNPNWDARARDFRPAYLDDIDDPGGLRRHASRRRRRSSPATAQVNGDFAAAADGAQAGGHAGEQDQLTLTPSGGNRYIALNTTDAAVRRHQRPQGGHRGLRPHRPAQHARRRARRADRDPLPPARTSPASRRPAASRARGSTSSPTRTAIPQLAAEYMKKAGYASGKYEGGDCEHHHGRRRLAARVARPPRSFKSQLEKLGLQGQPPAGHRTTSCTRSSATCRSRTSPSLPERRLAQGLQRRPVDARPDVQRRERSSRRTTPTGRSSTSRRSTRRSTRPTLIDDPEERAQAWGDDRQA